MSEQEHKVGPFKLTISDDGDAITSALSHESGEFIRGCRLEIARLEEEAVRRMLIRLGWTPPDPSTAKAE